MADITLSEKFARAIQDDIATILTTMATKTELRAVQKDVQELKNEMQGLKGDVSVLKEGVQQIHETMATKEDLRKYATFSDVRQIVSEAKNEILREIDPLRIRVGRVEEKVGIVPATR